MAYTGGPRGWGRCTQARCPITMRGLLLSERQSLRSFSSSFRSYSNSGLTSRGPGRQDSHVRQVYFVSSIARSEVNWKSAFFDETARLISRVIGFWRATVESSAKMNYGISFSPSPSFPAASSLVSLDRGRWFAAAAFNWAPYHVHTLLFIRFAYYWPLSLSRAVTRILGFLQ